ncbi:hypothetical protein TNCV_3811521 [Trichonephila clavipes]|nr:hypothetical protein TNCV_3811521 [Trichonephila clavipes]
MHVKSVKLKVFPSTWGCHLETKRPAQVSTLSLDRGSKLRGSSTIALVLLCGETITNSGSKCSCIKNLYESSIKEYLQSEALTREKSILTRRTAKLHEGYWRRTP